MSLNWDITKIKDADRVCWEKRTENDVEDTYLRSTTDMLIWATMAIDMGGITEANAAEFWDRLDLYERCLGSFRVKYNSETKKRDNVYFTKQDVIDHIGLSTNVRTITRAQFLKKLGQLTIQHHSGRRRISNMNAKGPLLPDEAPATPLAPSHPDA